MRLLVVALCLLAPLPAIGGYVIHSTSTDPDSPTVIAVDETNAHVLDRYGRAWAPPQGGAGWLRRSDFDPPVPISDLLFWQEYQCVSMSGEVFRNSGQAPWFSVGFPPEVSAMEVLGVPLELGTRAAPNPASDAIRISFTLPSPGPVQVRLFDPAGRLVRTLLDGDLPAGPVSLTWDGCDDRGEDVSAGVYFSRVETATGTIAGRIVIAR